MEEMICLFRVDTANPHNRTTHPYIEDSIVGIWPGMGGGGGAWAGTLTGTPGLLTAVFIRFRALANHSINR